MLCTICKKNKAITTIDNPDKTSDEKQIHLCYKCAMKPEYAKDILNFENLNFSDDQLSELNTMTSHLENMLQNMNINFNNEDENIDSDEVVNEDFKDTKKTNNNDNTKNDNINNNKTPKFGVLPLGNIFSNMFPGSTEFPFGNDEDLDDDNKQSKVSKSQKRKKALNTYGTNLTSKAKNNEIDIVIGRDEEIDRMIQILNRRTKNNPCLIGEPGVGKTALAQALAIRIANENVPAKLLSKEIYLLDMTAIISGTQFRGQFESRLKSIIDECKSLGNIILVIDEIHSLMSAGDSDHSMNAANILKPSLANGEIQLIGTTTLKEYRKHIEKDSALERRFQPIKINEPTCEDTIKILNGIKKYYETFHSVKISEDIISQIVLLSEKYIHDRFLPDKAIDILDEACSKVNLKNTDLFKLELLNIELKNIIEEQKSLENKTNDIDSENVEENEKLYQSIAELKSKLLSTQNDIKSLEDKIEIMNLTFFDIAEVIEGWTKIPIKKITEAESKKLLDLELNLHNRVIAQNKAVESVSRAIRRNRAGLKSTKRPPSFIFVGPTGVGKTELAKSLAFEMFGTDKSLIRIDMSEFMESHSTSKLIGSPPGYVGYDDAGQLTEKVKRNPYSIVLLDEIEKAHPEIFNLLLQVLDDGRLTDSQGNIINFENTIIIMTSNIGSNLNNNSIGFGGTQIDTSKMIDSLKESFRPEFLNRIDEIVIFESLNEPELLKIVDLMIKDTQKVLTEKNISIEVSKEAKQYLLKQGTDIKYGARPLRRSIQRHLEDGLSDLLLKAELVDGNNVYIDMQNNQINFKIK